ncbi:hypothetical protein GQ54DRAFT_132721 [Martensiomyces pterosporus]|nr:hypothetical protein GQ54DRAFT_132721 [Martensiomyces pterosporus]
MVVFQFPPAPCYLFLVLSLSRQQAVGCKYVCVSNGHYAFPQTGTEGGQTTARKSASRRNMPEAKLQIQSCSQAASQIHAIAHWLPLFL